MVSGSGELPNVRVIPGLVFSKVGLPTRTDLLDLRL